MGQCPAGNKALYHVLLHAHLDLPQQAPVVLQIYLALLEYAPATIHVRNYELRKRNQGMGPTGANHSLVATVAVLYDFYHGAPPR